MEQSTYCAEEHPFACLWMANCVLVVVAFMLMKGWKRESKDRTESRVKSDKWRKKYLEDVVEIRRKFSSTISELSRIRENRSLTKKGRENRAQLRNACHSLSATAPVSYIEKQKTLLKRLKACYGRKRTQEKAKALNRK